jgi:hypothetical protein
MKWFRNGIDNHNPRNRTLGDPGNALFVCDPYSFEVSFSQQHDFQTGFGGELAAGMEGRSFGSGLTPTILSRSLMLC